MASSVATADWIVLGDGESVVWTDRPSLYPIVPWVLLGLALAVLGVWSVRTITIPTGPLPVESQWIQALPLVLVPIGVVGSGWLYLRRWSVQYVLTSEVLYAKRGFLSRSVSQVRLDRIQNTAFTQSSIERLLGYGDVLVYAAGSDRTDLRLDDVRDPQGVNRTLSARLDESSRRSSADSEPSATPDPAGDDRAVL